MTLLILLYSKIVHRTVYQSRKSCYSTTEHDVVRYSLRVVKNGGGWHIAADVLVMYRRL